MLEIVQKIVLIQVLEAKIVAVANLQIERMHVIMLVVTEDSFTTLFEREDGFYNHPQFFYYLNANKSQ